MKTTEDIPEILASGAKADDNTTLATQSEPVSLNALNSISKKTEEEHGEGRNPAHAKNYLEDNPEVLGANTTLATQNEPDIIRCTQQHSQKKRGRTRRGTRSSPR